MGWWKVNGTDNIIGDGPLESLEGAILDVVAQYQEAFNRRPTKGEWASLLYAVLGSATTDERVTDDGTVKSVHVEVSRESSTTKT